jgi:hypothetical protein
MLANLLPGLREIRAPLTAGYVWLLAIYIAVEPHIPARGTETGIWETFAHLGDSISPAGQAAISAALAYVVGFSSELSVPPLLETVQGWRMSELRRRALPRFLWQWVRSRRHRDPFEHSAIYSLKGYGALMDILRPRLIALDQALRDVGTSLARAATTYHATPWSEREHLDRIAVPFALEPITEILQPTGAMLSRLTDFDGGTGDTVFYALDSAVDSLLEELDVVRTRLLGQEDELYSAIDRLNAEGEFRLALTLPGLALALTLGYRGAWVLGVAVLGLCVAALIQGIRRLEASSDMTFEALRIDRAQAPLLERLDEIVATLKQQATAESPAS